jgi:hypothetical protein
MVVTGGYFTTLRAIENLRILEMGFTLWQNKTKRFYARLRPMKSMKGLLIWFAPSNES